MPYSHGGCSSTKQWQHQLEGNMIDGAGQKENRPLTEILQLVR